MKVGYLTLFSLNFQVHYRFVNQTIMASFEAYRGSYSLPLSLLKLDN